MAYQRTVNAEDIAWQPLDFPGVAMKVVRNDEGTGQMTVLTRMNSGAEIPAHYHTYADETVYVLEGDFVEDGKSYAPGSFFVGKAKTTHGPHQTQAGCLLLTTFSAELDFQVVARPDLTT